MKEYKKEREQEKNKTETELNRDCGESQGGRFELYRVVSYRIVSYRIVSYRIVSCFVFPFVFFLSLSLVCFCLSLSFSADSLFINAKPNFFFNLHCRSYHTVIQQVLQLFQREMLLHHRKMR